jgi:hypothetical protein
MAVGVKGTAVGSMTCTDGGRVRWAWGSDTGVTLVVVDRDDMLHPLNARAMSNSERNLIIIKVSFVGCMYQPFKVWVARLLIDARLMLG